MVGQIGARQERDPKQHLPQSTTTRHMALIYCVMKALNRKQKILGVWSLVFLGGHIHQVYYKVGVGLFA